MNTTTTQAQQFAAAYAANMAAAMLKTIKYVRAAANVIMVIAMVASYTHQAAYLTEIGTPGLGAWGIPGALDALTFLCVKVIATPGMVQAAKTMALRVLLFPVAASGFINFAAPGELITKLVFVVAVLMIPAAELVASKIKPDFEAMDAMERDVTPTPAVEPVDETARARRSEAAKAAAAARREREAAAEAEASAKRAARSEAARKAAETRRERAALEEAYAMPNAPVSPAAPMSWEQQLQNA